MQETEHNTEAERSACANQTTHIKQSKIEDRLCGLGVALITPFDADGKVDMPSIDRLLHHIVGNGKADFLVLFGTTGESPTIRAEERLEILTLVRKTTPRSLPVVLGVGDNDTARLCDRLQNDVYKETDAILSVAPYYNKPSQEGLYKHFMAVAEASPCPVILYNIPGRSVVDILPETVCRLQQDSKNIIGIKEASGKVDRASILTATCRPDFVVLSGDDSLTREHCKLGARGVISVAGNAYPTLMRELVRATREGRHSDAEIIDERLRLMFHLLFAEGNPTGIKSLLASMGLIKTPNTRLPLCPASTELSELIAREHEEITRTADRL